ncbi:uncharacterized protein ACLA_087660 [Aspergillus clavatus NRRL 1]|uniref:Rhodopsin domain-containing protein n=1 Tax=Aspergillus clavatus (strain ATCC 1007 / CBS 513.65 / DSM 816 / NCTC 3887 / NRRL 1 / QM 1276 / 107) TaxID=344612 RepID=A1CUS3_ASPCL|nr:uncharacterized protein ACLA_087660 [Aspergillus clavatus NRRL 1]EAW07060.1 conserved hypothetical protein [Aspergillus clavatus NRRL 1]
MDVDPAYAKESHLGIILGVQTALTVTAVTVVALRLYVRIKITKTPGSDDWTMAAGAVCAIVGWALIIDQGHYGLGRHAAVISQENRIRLVQGKFWQIIFCSAAGIALVKVSLALSLMRFSLTRWYTWSLWASIVFVSAYSFLAAMTFFLHCRPMKAHWDTRIKGAQCYSLHLFVIFGLINTAFNIFTDVLFATLPIPIVWRLKMKRRVRIYLTGILSLGYIAVGMGILKTIWQLAYAKNPDRYLAQFNTAILAASIPSLKPLFNRLLHLSDSRSRDQYDSRPRGQNSGIQSTNGGRSPMWSQHRGDQYALQELESNDSSKKSDPIELTTVTHPKTAGTSSRGGDRHEGHSAEDEQAILTEWPPAARGRGGIWKTTEVIVR